MSKDCGVPQFFERVSLEVVRESSGENVLYFFSFFIERLD